jgi:hypothetical protein
MGATGSIMHLLMTTAFIDAAGSFELLVATVFMGATCAVIELCMVGRSRRRLMCGLRGIVANVWLGNA